MSNYSCLLVEGAENGTERTVERTVQDRKRKWGRCSWGRDVVNGKWPTRPENHSQSLSMSFVFCHSSVSYSQSQYPSCFTDHLHYPFNQPFHHSLIPLLPFLPVIYTIHQKPEWILPYGSRLSIQLIVYLFASKHRQIFLGKLFQILPIWLDIWSLWKLLFSNL